MKERLCQEDRMKIKNSLYWMFEIIKNVKEGELTARDQWTMGLWLATPDLRSLFTIHIDVIHHQVPVPQQAWPRPGGHRGRRGRPWE